MNVRAIKSFAAGIGGEVRAIRPGDEFEVDAREGRRMVHRQMVEEIKPPKRKRGRPKGSKNKPKPVERAEEPPPAEMTVTHRDVEVVPDVPIEATDG